jgi:isoquinoline 1-oxidoreductase subunit beta
MDRREFLKVGGGLVVGFTIASRHAGAADWQPNAWLRIAPSGEITVLIEGSDLGQGIWTGMAKLAAEELEADWRSIRLEQAPADPGVYKNMSTGGSGGIEGTWDSLRRAGAQTREMLISAAAANWNTTRTECRAELSAVIHRDGRRAAYGELADAASKLPVPDPATIALKDPKDFRIIGKPVPRKDVPPKVNGAAKYGIDVQVSGMLYAVVARCPTFGGKPAKFDAAVAKAVPGVRAVVEIEPVGKPTNAAGGIAVVAENTWAAMQGRKALNLTWNRGPNASESSATLLQLAEQQLNAPATVVVVDKGAPPASAAKELSAVYELPFQAHAPMEPMNATVDARADRIECWTGTQWPLSIQMLLSRLSGMPREKITVHNQWSGGSFGRRGQWDYPIEAWQISKAVAAPVKLLWTREDDMQHDFYRPLSFHKMSGALDAEGRPLAWTHRIVSTAIRETFDSPERLADPKWVARQELEGGEILYAVPRLKVDFAPLKSAVPRAWWRSVATSFNAFAVECFIDEMAAAAGKDPLQYRLSLLSDQRLRTVLQLAAEKAKWGERLPAAWGRGIAAFHSFDTYVAYVATVSTTPAIRVRNVVAAVDCGTVIDPDSVKMMLEGAANFGLGAALTAEITIANGAVQQTNFDSYRPLRMSAAPAMEVHIVESHEPPGGMGEPGVPPIAPAVANAIFAATGKRIRRLPLLS